MVLLHALEHGADLPRGSTDLDALVNARDLVPRPSLRGAVVAKAVAVTVTVDDAPDAQRRDLALLRSRVEDPLALRSELTKKDRQRFAARDEMTDADSPAWRSLAPGTADRGRATYRLPLS